VQCSMKGNSVVTSIRDTGSGIAPEELLFVFERFYRAEPSRQRGMRGQGLGLSIVKQIVEAHQGQVWAESELGKVDVSAMESVYTDHSPRITPRICTIRLCHPPRKRYPFLKYRCLPSLYNTGKIPLTLLTNIIFINDK
jgi:hypothetical protein